MFFSRVHLTDGDLVIDTVKLSDAGRYACKASSDQGPVWTNFTLAVSTLDQLDKSVDELPDESEEAVKGIVRDETVEDVDELPDESEEAVKGIVRDETVEDVDELPDESEEAVRGIVSDETVEDVDELPDESEEAVKGIVNDETVEDIQNATMRLSLREATIERNKDKKEGTSHLKLNIVYT